MIQLVYVGMEVSSSGSPRNASSKSLRVTPALARKASSFFSVCNGGGSVADTSPTEVRGLVLLSRIGIMMLCCLRYDAAQRGSVSQIGL